jgi:hypothetical protein
MSKSERPNDLPKETTMQAHAAPFFPLFEAFFPPKAAKIEEDQTTLRLNPLPEVSLRRSGEYMLSMARAYERLSLLVHLELPCTILIANPYQLLRATVIKAVELLGENLTIHGDGFNLRLYGTNFYTLRLVNHRHKENGNTSLDIHDFNGLLYASIQPTQDGTGAAVWRDVMENPLLSLA